MTEEGRKRRWFDVDITAVLSERTDSSLLLPLKEDYYYTHGYAPM